MHHVRRFLAIGPVLGLIAIVTCSHLWGEPGQRDPLAWRNKSGDASVVRKELPLEMLSVTRFAKQPVVTYRTSDGETFFAFQLQPRLDMPAQPRPVDYMILVSTSASMGKGELALAQKVTEAFIKQLGPQDRVGIATVNTEYKELTDGLQPADQVQEALKTLDKQVPYGAADLKRALETATKRLEKRSSRQNAIVFLGDGKSIINPITADDRARLCRDMTAREIGFFPVPLGLNMDPANLHGLASGTGGAPVRLLTQSKKMDATIEAQKATTPADKLASKAGELIADETALKLKETVATPILYPTKFQAPAEAVEVFPAEHLPPLRTDSPTLLVGKMKATPELTFAVTGSLAGQPVTVRQTEKVPEPEVENFFLGSMVRQWRTDKDRPALVRADRALAFAYDQNLLARADLLGQAEMAIDDRKYEVAIKLFDQVQALDPSSPEAKTGRTLIEQLKDGKLTRDELRKQITPKAGEQMARLDGQAPERKIEHVAAVNQLSEAPQDNANPARGDDLLQRTKQRQALEDQRTTQLVDEAIRQARSQMQNDPEAARDNLKRTLEALLGNPDLSDRTRAALTARGEAARRDLDLRAGRILADMDARLRAYQSAVERERLNRSQQLEDDRIASRIRVFHNYMDLAREDLAALQMQNIRQDLINEGRPVPPAVLGGYKQGIWAHQMRELNELKRVREERWLLVLNQVDRSFVPFPDEPPVQFPPIAAWKALRDLRKERYESSGLGTGAEISKATLELRDKLGQTVDFEGLDDNKATLLDALDLLRTRYKLTFDVNESAFKAEGVEDPLSKPVADRPIPKMFGVSLATVLNKILSRVPTTSGATYIIRRNLIEITTTKFQIAEKTLRVYPVLDVVTPTPQSVNAQQLFQNSTLFWTFGQAGQLGALGVSGLGNLGAQGFGGALGALGGGLGALGALGALGGGGLGALGALGGGGLGALGALGGGGLGALGGGALGGGGLGALGGGALGGGLGAALGNFGAGGIGALGGGGIGALGQIGQAGSGQLGSFGQQGQFGNLGGQFGLQGGNQSQLLILLIRSVIGNPRDWAPLGGNSVNPAVPGPGAQPEDDPNAVPEANNLGYYPPAGALVVKGTSRIHTRPTPLINTGNVPPNPVVLGERPGHRIIGGDEQKGNGPVANANNRRGDKKENLDPKTMWEDALAKGVDDPGLIIACADYLVLNRKFDHAAEFLKAELKQGIVVAPWVYQSLSIALQEGGGSPEEIERAQVSAADLQPMNGDAFLKAAEAMKDLKRYDRAVAFCRQAALLQPESPQAYDQCLVCAEQAKDVDSLAWAAGNLIRRDWVSDNDDLQMRATTKAEALARLLQKEKRSAEAEKLRAAVKSRQRDLVIKLKWQGEADLDLYVTEPCGSTCSWLSRQTVGGGTLLGDTLEEASTESYVAAEAFPGAYTIKIKRGWGRPTGDRAQVLIVEHQGTPEETTRVETIDLKTTDTLSVQLTAGRRTSTATVPPPGSIQHKRPQLEVGIDKVLDKMRGITSLDPIGSSHGMSGGSTTVSTSAEDVAAPTSPKELASSQVTFQNRVSSCVNNGVDVTAQAAVTANGRFVKMSLSPVFNDPTKMDRVPVVTNPLLPSGGNHP